MLMIGFIFLHDRDLGVCQTHFALDEAAPDFQAIWKRLRAHFILHYWLGFAQLFMPRKLHNPRS